MNEWMQKLLEKQACDAAKSLNIIVYRKNKNS